FLIVRRIKRALSSVECRRSRRLVVRDEHTLVSEVNTERSEVVNKAAECLGDCGTLGMYLSNELDYCCKGFSRDTDASLTAAAVGCDILTKSWVERVDEVRAESV